MANSRAFEKVCELLEERVQMSRLALRGTVRLALKEAGLDAARASGEQMAVVVEKLLPDELTRRGIDDAQDVCRAVCNDLRALDLGKSGQAAEDVFRRLGGDE